MVAEVMLLFHVAAPAGMMAFVVVCVPLCHIHITFKKNQDWSYTDAALESSSFMDLNPFMQWVTANIGFHHIHHLNSKIPFYRLPEAMAAIPELQQAKITTLKASDISACLRLKVWDSEQNKMIGFKEMDEWPLLKYSDKKPA